ncbi:MAG: hypothetical protein A3J35_04355 [Gammaproteobacteria bacterium RIFCSPLOWO2_02_FULL_52_10]|nr:MAG: hypothetical protein A3J35_04355 [Gammaproteobacteria bacterium RIFCSPLOWO2_02_FULL_52_10]
MAAALTIISTLVSVVGAIRQGQSQAASSDYNAAVARNNAVYARQVAAENERRQRILTRKTIGGARAGYGASGVTLEGTPLDVPRESAANAELDALTIRHQGELAARGYENTATLDTFAASGARTGGYISAADELLTGGAKLYNNYNPPKLTRTG